MQGSRILSALVGALLQQGKRRFSVGKSRKSINRALEGCVLHCAALTRTVAFRKGAQQVPRLPPDFLSSLVASIDLMRLSLLKAAYVAVD